MQLPVYNKEKEVVRTIDVSDYLFAEPFNEAVVHQAMVRQRANARQGTASTKTRGEVSGSKKKLYRQKHTGNARAGHRRAPTRVGGGIVFGPHPRDFRQAMPKKMRRLALRCMLSAKAQSESMMIIDSLQIEKPSTREMEDILRNLGIANTALIITAKAEENVVKSARNIAGARTLPANLLNVIDLMNHRTVLITEDAVRTAEDIWGERVASEVNSESL